MFPESLRQPIEQGGFVAVLVIEDADRAVPLARALARGGIRAIELTLRTPAAMEALRRIRAEVTELLTGVGTVLTTRQLHEALAAGAQFGVAPGTNPRVVAEARQIGMPFAPGVCTPTDIEMALEHDCRWLKFFPAAPCGGRDYLRSMAAPFRHLQLRFLALGGITRENLGEFVGEPLVAAVGGSWVVPESCLQTEDWEGIAARAASVTLEIRRLRQAGNAQGEVWV